ncbi:unnamed protein product [Miscanthus lutarioriparius]|uniref:Uncharacterized protein n=1 Tax=Miscanthus lutarioriparius TaxID=422564 RepID=A0A811QQ65_9POAL|nr:unnamed protein product [Miscanthus lutarioriparius]
MAGNNVLWQPQVMEDMLRCYKEKIQAEGRLLFFRETSMREFSVLQAPYDLPSTQDGDLIGDKNANHGEDVHLGLQYDSECLAEEDGNNGGSSSSKRPAASKPEKVKRIKRDDRAISERESLAKDWYQQQRFVLH